MEKTLYMKAVELDEIGERVRNMDKSNTDTSKLQRSLFQTYEGNPVFYDAMQGKQSIEGSFRKLGQIKKGIRKIIPWKRNKGHNERLEQLEELIYVPSHLHTSGIFMPDNFITAGLEIGALMFGGFYLFLKNLIPEADLDPKSLSFGASGTCALICGVVANLNRFNRLQNGAAKYLDEKIQEFYR